MSGRLKLVLASGSPRRQGPKRAGLQLIPQFGKEPRYPTHGLDIAGGLAVHPGGACPLVTPHPIPRNQKKRRIGDEVVQIIEPAIRIITGPTVQLGLDLQYPALCLQQNLVRTVGIHQRPPGIPALSLPTC